LDVQNRHAGIKARGAGNEKRGEKPRLANTLLATAQTIFSNVENQSNDCEISGWDDEN
jgi:hypothetical protein